MSKFGLITKGIVKENPTFSLVLGMCPTIATTTSAINGLGMGLATTFVLVLSNMLIAAVAPVIPAKIKIPSYIVIIASLVTVLQFVMQAYVPDLYATLGIFIPLIVVNCIILGRAEAFACKHSVVIGFVRELLGGLAVFGNRIAEGDGMLAFVLAPGGFLVLGYLMVLFRKVTKQ